MTLINPKQSFQRRRQRLSKALEPNSIAIILATEMTFRNKDVEHEWRQDSTFDYLTGIQEAENILIISNIETIADTIFCPAKDPKKETWEGTRIGTEAMIDQYGMQYAYGLDELDEKMPDLLTQCQCVYFDFGDDNTWDKRLFAYIKQLQRQSRPNKQAPEKLHFLSPIVAKMRLFKDKAEQALMREAGRISVLAHKSAMQKAREQNHEAQVAATLEYSMRQHGAERTAFGSIVASGANACTLHYRHNNQYYEDNVLMIIDAGAEYQGYASDISTTFPTGGKFNEAQRQIYQAVLDTHEAVLSECKPGATFDSLQQLSCQHICQALVTLGILQGEIDELIAQKAYQRYYMHRIGHWIGRDVHDVGKYHEANTWQPLQADMTLTIEPGIYLLANEEIEEKWWNIGVRIEDTLLITEDGYENLTPNLPRTIKEIECFLKSSRPLH